MFERPVSMSLGNLCDSIPFATPSELQDHFDNSRIYIFSTPLAVCSSVSYGFPYQPVIPKRRNDGDGFWVLTKCENERSLLLVVAFGICVKEGMYTRGRLTRISEDGLLSLILDRPIETDSGSGVALNRVINWVKECNKHVECGIETTPPKLPYRVIDIGIDNNSLRLLERTNEIATYITLSHCWGISKHLTTTKSSLTSRMRGISFNELPKTFQNTVIVTREFKGKIYLD